MPAPRQPLIAFDLDGTLIDSQQDLADSANELLASFGADPLPADAVAGMVGDGARVLVKRVLVARRLDPERPDPLERFLAIYDRRLANHTRFYPGVHEMLAPLAARAKLAIVTNKAERHTRALLDIFEVTSLFPWVVGGDSGFPRKPDPAGLVHVIREAGASPDDTLFVGDSMVDIETGRRAGVRVCVAAYGFAQFRKGLTLDGTELVAERPEELARAIGKFLGD